MDIELPEHRKLTEEDRELLMWDLKLQNYWKTSPYNLDEEKSEDTYIERYSDRAKKRQRLSRQPLSSYLNLEPGYFPRDLLPGVKSSGVQKMKCKQNIDLQLDQLFDKFEKKEQELKSGKESEDEEKDDEKDDEKDEDEESGDFSNDDDYEQDLKSEKESEDEDEESGDFSDDGDYEQDQELKSGKESEIDEKDEDKECGDFNNDDDYEQVSGGITVKKTGQALIFGIYDEPVTPGQCNKAVEKLGDYLIEQGL